MSTRHLSQIELAARWNLSPRTLERWRFTGEGPQFVKLGGRVVYRLEDIEGYEAEQTRAIHPELFHYTSLDAFEKKWRFIRLERNAAEPVSGPAGPSESLRTCLQSGLPAAPPRSYQHSAQRFRFESPSLRQRPRHKRAYRRLQGNPRVNEIPGLFITPAEAHLPS